MIRATPDHLQRQGEEFYPRTHEQVEHDIRHTSLSPWQGAGIVAAVSPGMNYERHNVGAIHELGKLREGDWDTIHRSSQNRVYSPKVGRMVPTRTGEAKSVLQGYGISRAPDSQLLKAHAIMQGQDPEDVLSVRTSPKTNSFAHNIHEPENEHFLTVDGRIHDIGLNRLIPWDDSSRGISSAGLKTGKPTRYEQFRDAATAAAHSAGLKGPAGQAVMWFGGKNREMNMPGAKADRGPDRIGQPYQ